ncbi:hypothetical protein ADE_46820 [Achromobacter denitrificans]|jgi:hypothetical protein|nr:hypothetical protein ADE_46820 [Achromobacter denitrificans]
MTPVPQVSAWREYGRFIMSISCRRLEDVIAVSGAGVQYRIERHLVQQPTTDPNVDACTVLTCRLSTGGTVTREGDGVYRLETGEILRAVARRRKKSKDES